MRKTLRSGWPLAALVLAALVAVSVAPGAGYSQTATKSTSPKTGEGWLGVSTQEIDDDLREGLDYDGHGVIVSSVASNGPAARAGVRSGDVIVSFNSRIVDTPSDLASAVRAGKPGQKISLRIVRDGTGMTQAVTLGNREDAPDAEWEEAPAAPRAPGAPAAPKSRSYRWYSSDDFEGLHDLEDLPGFRSFQFHDGNGFTMLGRGRLGVRIEDLDGDLGGYFDVPNGEGALVIEVYEDTPAAKAGIKAGDVITKIGDASVKDANDLQRAVREAEGNVAITVMRKGASRTVQTDLGEAPRVVRLHERDHARPRADRIVIRGEDRDELRRELEALREELRELRRELDENDRKQ